uniref:C-type lectin domain-containing protein n=1 Tax=Neolamprologus brichardi TaxID=32507 RepID=A0A3Q4G7F7_NEOBR
MSRGEKKGDREEVLKLAAWCSDNNLALNTKKTKENIVNFKRHSTDMAPYSSTVTVWRGSTPSDLNTQQGWVYFRGSFYYISYIKKSWSDSREDCLQRGADLVIISSTEEQVQTNFIRLFRRNTWIGLSDTEEEGTWKWVDGSLYWRTGEPNSLVNEDCGVMAANDEENCWNDANCRDENFWICEKKMEQ